MLVKWRRELDIIATIVMLLNIPMVLLFETQAILPTWIFPKHLQSLLRWHVNTNNDFFLRRAPPFYIGVVAGDILIRVPLIFLNTYAFYHGKSWGNVTGILYGVHTTSTMILFARVANKHRLLSLLFPQFLAGMYTLHRGLSGVETPAITHQESSFPYIPGFSFPRFPTFWNLRGIWNLGGFWNLFSKERNIPVSHEQQQQGLARNNNLIRANPRISNNQRRVSNEVTPAVRNDPSCSGPSTSSRRQGRRDVVRTEKSVVTRRSRSLTPKKPKKPDKSSSTPSPSKRKGRRQQRKSRSRSRSTSRTRRIALRDFINNATIVVRR